MKKIIQFSPALLLLLLFVSVSTFAQTDLRRGQFGFHFSPLTSNSLSGNRLDGAQSLSIAGASGFGVNYIKPVSPSFSWETGVDYSLFKVQSISAGANPEIPKDTTATTLSLVQIPFAFRAYFADILFFTGGMLLDFDMNSASPVTNQTGMGLLAGLGVSYDFKSGLTLYANPYVKAHSLVPFGTWKNRDRVLESGIRFGVMYRL